MRDERKSQGRSRKGVLIPVPPLKSEMDTANFELRDVIVTRIKETRLRFVIQANTGMITLYWNIGNDILRRQETEGWGAKVIDRLSADLKEEFPEMSGFSPRNLKYMRRFAETWTDSQIVQQPVAQLQWRSILILLTNFYLLRSLVRSDSRTESPREYPIFDTECLMGKAKRIRPESPAETVGAGLVPARAATRAAPTAALHGEDAVRYHGKRTRAESPVSPSVGRSPTSRRKKNLQALQGRNRKQMPPLQGLDLKRNPYVGRCPTLGDVALSGQRQAMCIRTESPTSHGRGSSSLSGLMRQHKAETRYEAVFSTLFHFATHCVPDWHGQMTVCYGKPGLSRERNGTRFNKGEHHDEKMRHHSIDTHHGRVCGGGDADAVAVGHLRPEGERGRDLRRIRDALRTPKDHPPQRRGLVMTT